MVKQKDKIMDDKKIEKIILLSIILSVKVFVFCDEGDQMYQDLLYPSALLVARLTLGTILFAHGTQKVFGWFGGYGVKGTYGYFKNTLHVPAPLALVGVFAEFIASISLILGVFTRGGALLAAVQMLVAIYLSHRGTGFFMNYFGQLPAGKEGYEYNLALAGLALVIALIGAGPYALDAAWRLNFLPWRG